MCWTSHNYKHPVKIIADEDIKVFKIVNRNLTSVYEDFQYEIEREYKLMEPIVLEIGSTAGMWLINKGFHSYCFETVKIYVDYYSNIFSHETIQEISIYTKFGRNDKFVGDIGKYIIAECIIPKGSTYYINEFGEIVSDKISITGIREIE